MVFFNLFVNLLPLNKCEKVESVANNITEPEREHAKLTITCTYIRSATALTVVCGFQNNGIYEKSKILKLYEVKIFQNHIIVVFFSYLENFEKIIKKNKMAECKRYFLVSEFFPEFHVNLVRCQHKKFQIRESFLKLNTTFQ